MSVDRTRKIAVVEDSEEDAALLKGYLEKYSAENQVPVEICMFSNGMNFLDEYKADCDVVFMDIEMPHMDGLETAKRLRDADRSVSLIFITGMIQYAVSGYEVNAIDFIVKPVGYYNLCKKLERALRAADMRYEKKLLLTRDETMTVVPAGDIYYIEKEGNYLVFHTASGEFRKRGTMADISGELSKVGFSKCSSGCMINLAHVTEFRADSVLVMGTKLPVARRHKKELMTDFVKYYGGNA